MKKKTDVFYDSLIHRLKPLLMPPKDNLKNIAYYERFKADIFGEAIPEKYKPQLKLTSEEEFLMRVSRCYIEVLESLVRLEMLTHLIDQYPALPSWKKVGISKVVYLKMIYEVILNEMYIYRERMKILLLIIKKQCQKKSLFEDGQAVAGCLTRLSSAFKHLTEVRGRHIHQNRYRDSKLDQLGLLELLMQNMPVAELKAPFKGFFAETYREARKQYAKNAKDYSAQLSKMKENIVSVILPIVFKKLYPNVAK